MADNANNKNNTPDNDASGPKDPVVLVKGVHRWTFACERGDEKALLKRVSELARAESVPFDWFDAALVTHQLSERLRPGLIRVDGAGNKPVSTSH